MHDPMTAQAREVARRLSYNDREVEAEAKHLLIDVSRALDARNVRAIRTSEGLVLVNGYGRQRLATWRERMAYWLAGSLPSRL
jgi:hypothetical protein